MGGSGCSFLFFGLGCKRGEEHPKLRGVFATFSREIDSHLLSPRLLKSCRFLLSLSSAVILGQFLGDLWDPCPMTYCPT